MFDVANIGRISESSKFSENYLSHIEVRHFCVMGYYIQSVAPRGKDGGTWDPVIEGTSTWV